MITEEIRGAPWTEILTAQKAGFVETVAFTLYLFSEVHGFLAHATFFSSSPVWHPVEGTNGKEKLRQGEKNIGLKHQLPREQLKNLSRHRNHPTRAWEKIKVLHVFLVWHQSPVV